MLIDNINTLLPSSRGQELPIETMEQLALVVDKSISHQHKYKKSAHPLTSLFHRCYRRRSPHSQLPNFLVTLAIYKWNNRMQCNAVGIVPKRRKRSITCKIIKAPQLKDIHISLQHFFCIWCDLIQLHYQLRTCTGCMFKLLAGEGLQELYLTRHSQLQKHAKGCG